MWKQRSKERSIAEGDLNTKFFHNFANARKRKNLIKELKIEGRGFPTIRRSSRGSRSPLRNSSS